MVQVDLNICKVVKFNEIGIAASTNGSDNEFLTRHFVSIYL